MSLVSPVATPVANLLCPRRAVLPPRCVIAVPPVTFGSVASARFSCSCSEYLPCGRWSPRLGMRNFAARLQAGRRCPHVRRSSARVARAVARSAASEKAGRITSIDIMVFSFHERRCDFNRSLWFWASIVCLRFIAERWSANGRGFSHRSSGASRRATLTGSSPVCMIFRKTKTMQPVEKDQVCKGDSSAISDSRFLEL